MDNYRVATPKANILVVNDRIDDLILLMGLLTLHGYHVQIAKNVKYVQEACKDTRPDIVLWDLAMLTPENYQESALLDGENHPNIPMIFMSESTEPSVKMESFELRGVHLTKPFNEKELLVSIEVLLAWQYLQKAA